MKGTKMIWGPCPLTPHTNSTGKSRERFSLKMLSASENTLSENTLEAGIDMYYFASCGIRGNTDLCFPQKKRVFFSLNIPMLSDIRVECAECLVSFWFHSFVILNFVNE